MDDSASRSTAPLQTAALTFIESLVLSICNPQRSQRHHYRHKDDDTREERHLLIGGQRIQVVHWALQGRVARYESALLIGLRIVPKDARLTLFFALVIALGDPDFSQPRGGCGRYSCTVRAPWLHGTTEVSIWPLADTGGAECRALSSEMGEAPSNPSSSFTSQPHRILHDFSRWD